MIKLQNEKLEKYRLLIQRKVMMGLFTKDELYILEEGQMEIESYFPYSQYHEFLKRFNELREMKAQPDLNSWRQFKEHQHAFTVNDRITAVKNAMESQYFIDNPNGLYLKKVCEPSFISQYLNYKKSNNNKTINYDQVQEI